jgi:histidinol phosphatase-like PHP family hydrolase
LYRAVKKKLPKLVRDADIRGILHAHTILSDGGDTLDEMVNATRKRGYQYFGVADHSKSAHYAGGLSLEEIGEQHRAIDALNKHLGKDFRIFKGIESDILADGSLDYSDEVLARFDFVVASIHGRFKLEKKVQTERILRAVAHRNTTILGHMTGRQLLRRPGYEIDVEKVLKACAKYGVAVEINANPWRPDLDWRWHGRALELGCMMSINPDAHSADEIDLTHWGVEIAPQRWRARRPGVELPAPRSFHALLAAAEECPLELWDTALLASFSYRSWRDEPQEPQLHASLRQGVTLAESVGTGVDAPRPPALRLDSFTSRGNLVSREVNW